MTYPFSPGYVKISDTSKAAASSIGPAAPILSALVAQYVKDTGSATCDEVEAALGLRHQTASARLRELVLKGVIEDSGQRRLTRSNRKAVVYTPCEGTSQAGLTKLKKRTLYVVLNPKGFGAASYDREVALDYMATATEGDVLAMDSVEVDRDFCAC